MRIFNRKANPKAKERRSFTKRVVDKVKDYFIYEETFVRSIVSWLYSSIPAVTAGTVLDALGAEQQAVAVTVGIMAAGFIAPVVKDFALNTKSVVNDYIHDRKKEKAEKTLS